MSKIDEMAAKAAADRFPDICGTTSSERFDPYKESKIQSIKQDAFADGYKQAIADCYPVVKPKDAVAGKRYWIEIAGGAWRNAEIDESGWRDSRGFSVSLNAVFAIRGPILSPAELGMEGER